MSAIAKRGWRLYAQIMVFCRDQPKSAAQIAEGLSLSYKSTIEVVKDMATCGIVREVMWERVNNAYACPYYSESIGQREPNPITGKLDSKRVDHHRPIAGRLVSFGKMVEAMRYGPRSAVELARDLKLYEEEVRSLFRDGEKFGAFRVAGYGKALGDKGAPVTLWCCDGGESVRIEVEQKDTEPNFWQKGLAQREFDRAVNFALAGYRVHA